MRCSVAMGPRFFKWNMLRESGPYALLLLQLLIAPPTALDCTGDLVAD